MQIHILFVNKNIFFYYLAIYDAVIAILFELFRYISKHTGVYKTSLAVKMQIKICNL